MKVEEIMTSEVASCEPRTNAAAAAELMWQRNCGALPIVDMSPTGRRVVGIVTDRDLFIALGTRNQPAGEVPIESIMQRDVATCRVGDNVSEALSTMAERRLFRLPVVDQQGELRGMLSVHDIVQHAGRKLGGPSPKDLLEALKAIGERQSPAVATPVRNVA